MNNQDKANFTETGDKTLLIREGALYSNQKYTFIVKEVNGQFDAGQLLGFLQKLDRLNKFNQSPVLVDLDVQIKNNQFQESFSDIPDEIVDNILSRAQFFSKLALEKFRFTKPQLEKIHAAEFKYLKEFQLTDCSVDDEQMEFNNQQLQFNDESLQRIAKNPHFPQDIKFSLGLGDAITDEGIRGLNISSLRLGRDAKITDAGLKNVPNLTSLTVSGDNRITDVGLLNVPNLTSLVLDRNTQITDAGFLKLSQLTSLVLYDNIQITDAGLLSLKNLQHLELIGMSIAKFSSEALKILRARGVVIVTKSW